MRIALLQGIATPLDPERNLIVVREAASEAAQQGAELLLTPELFVSGYDPLGLSDWLSADNVGSMPAALAAIAKEAGIAIAAGLPLTRPDGGFAIGAGLWNEDGDLILTYEKVHLWGDERLGFTASEDPPRVVDWNGRRVGFQICFDIEFPEPTRWLAEQGADLVLVPTAIDSACVYVPEVVVRTRAAENGIVVAYADHARSESDDYVGLSIVAGPEGAIYARSMSDAKALLIADLPQDLDLQADYLRERRPGVYAEWPRRVAKRT